MRAAANDPTAAFLPVSREEMYLRGWDRVDFVYVCGDAYVDHPSFGAAIITRLLESRGYRVGILAQPDWRDDSSVTVFGEPRLGFLVSAGNMDSMVNHYTVAKKRRGSDAYSPGGKTGLRPDRACIVYSNLIRRTYKHTPIILGGIEASLRRLAHYDYWADSLKRSILVDSGADLISYGMGEHSIVEIAEALAAGIEVGEITYVAGTAYRRKELPGEDGLILLPSYEEMLLDRTAYARSFAQQYRNTDPFTAHPLAEDYGSRGYVIQNVPSRPLTRQEMDDVYALPFTGHYHPSYEAQGGIPALSEVRFSLTSSRGCFGSCSFCSLTFHEGRIVQARSHASILEEAERMTREPDFKGYIHDVGGPTADFRGPACAKQMTRGACADRQCLFPKPCPNLKVDHKDYLALLRKLRGLPGVKKVFIRSGVRFDYVVADKDRSFIRELAEYHVSGQLRVAPEHVSAPVLRLMGKPEHRVYQEFLQLFAQADRAAGKKQYAVPYFMSSHPGCTLRDAVALAEYIRDMGFLPEQVQDFYPTPSTLSTCMYYTGMHPLTGEKVYIPKDPHEKAMQRALMQYRRPEEWPLVVEALKKAGRTDLIGFGPKCLVRPRPPIKERGGRKPGKKNGVLPYRKQKQGKKTGKGEHESK